MSSSGSLNNKHYIPVYPPLNKKEKSKSPNKCNNEINKSQIVLRDFLNYQTSQQAVFIALLSLNGKVVIGKPLKRSSVTRQYIRVISMGLKENKMIECENEIENRCNEKKRIDIKNGVSEKTANRRFKTNKRTESMNLLIEELKRIGFSFESRLTEGKKETSKLETVYKIIKNDKLLLDSNQIDLIGEKINKLLFQLVSTNCDPVILCNNNDINQILLSVINKDLLFL